jgi:hypothetical protein
MRFWLALMSLAAVTACASASPIAPAPLSREITLAPGQTATVGGAAIAVRFEGVSGDSRCPADALCILGGDAAVRIQVVPATGTAQAYTLHTGDMRPVTHGDLTIALVQLAPYPFSATPIDPADYRATLRVTR